MTFNKLTSGDISLCVHVQPVDFYPPTEAGFHDIFGNVWEWTEDHFNGLPGAKSDYLYQDFSIPFYDGKHNLILVSYMHLYK